MPSAALMTKLTFAPAVSVILARLPAPAVIVILLFVGPNIMDSWPTGGTDTLVLVSPICAVMKLAVMLSPDAAAGFQG